MVNARSDRVARQRRVVVSLLYALSVLAGGLAIVAHDGGSCATGEGVGVT